MIQSIPLELEQKLHTCRSLPSPPSYALEVIELNKDPEVDIEKAVQVFSKDPAIVSKILRIANSPLYANQRKVEALQLAILVLGLNATTSLALSFSLVSELRQHEGTLAAFNFPLYWKRTGLAAVASRVLGQYRQIPDLEELFIASLLQDIGMLALHRTHPDLYAQAELNQHDALQMVSHEEENLGVNHATVGGWLLAQWNLPERLSRAVAFSEDPIQYSKEDELTEFIRCVAGSGILANLLLNETHNHDLLEHTGKQLRKWVDLPFDRLPDLLDQMKPVLEEMDQLFDLNINSDVNAADLIEAAREDLLLKNLAVCQEIEQQKESIVSLEAKNEALEGLSQRDGLTGVFNRGFLDGFLEKAFQKAVRDDACLSIAFLDLDDFKVVNDTYGHHAGDQVLISIAEHIKNGLRSSDVVGRYGGEEFVVVLPGTPAEGARNVMQRILDTLRQTQHTVSMDRSITVTASIGIATHSKNQAFPKVEALVEAADQALYTTKRHGRNRIRVHGAQPVSMTD